ncbi:MAG: pyridoxamine 5'-phosphate oxidase family protein [Methanobacterium sp.]|nr:pyridoxamine 5'-phosphate oxidase family protein [Methanobacterium sp.]
MRRKDKEIIDEKVIKQILEKSLICRIALCDRGRPYLVPMNFGFKNNRLYLHSASEGRKIEILRRNNNVCFEMDSGIKVVKAEKPCQWGMKYSSIIGTGKARFIEDFQKKIEAINIIMQKYAPNRIFRYDDEMVKDVCILIVEIDELTGKMSL